MKPVDVEEAIIHKKKQLDNDGRYHRINYENKIPQKKKNCINTWDSSSVGGRCKQKPIIKKIPTMTVDEGVSKMMCQLS